MTDTPTPEADRPCPVCGNHADGVSPYCSRPCQKKADTQRQKQARRDAAFAELTVLRNEVEQLRAIIARHVPEDVQRRYGLRLAAPDLVPGRPETWPDILSVDQVVQAIGYSDQHVRRLLREGRIRGHRPPGTRRWLIHRADLIEDLVLIPGDQRGRPQPRP